MNVSLWMSRIIKAGFYLLFALIPLLLTPWNYELFEYNKMMAVYAITVIIAVAWIVRLIHEKDVKIAKTPLDIPIALFVISQLVSSLFSIDPHVSWLGYYSRFNGGMWSVISYVFLYYAFVSNMQTPSAHDQSPANIKYQKSKIKNSGQAENIQHATMQQCNSVILLLKVTLASASVVALYGVAERLGVDKHLWVQDVQNRVFSTLGQPNWLAAYLVALMPLTWYFVLKTQNPKQYVSGIENLNLGFIWNLKFVIWNLISVLFFLGLLFTRSRSGLLGLAVADIIFWAYLYLNTASHGAGKFQSLALKSMTVLHILFASIIFFNGSNIAQLDKYFSLPGLLASKGDVLQGSPSPDVQTGPALESGGTESGEIRKYVWQGALNAWKSTTKTMLIGTGTETFAFAFYQHRPVGHNMTSEWDFLYNKAHNEYLNYLATTGVIGLGSYLLFIGSFIIWFVKNVHGSWFMVHSKNKTNEITTNNEQITMNSALFAGWLSILVTNFFGFSVVVVQLFLFLFPAILLVSSQQFTIRTIKQLKPPAWTAWIIVLTGIIFIVRIVAMWQADTLYATGYRLNRSEQFEQARLALERALILNPAEPVYHDEIATTYASLALVAFDEQDATKTATLAQRALAQNDTSVRTSPSNVNFWKTRTKVYYALSALDPALNDAAVEALKRAIRLSPNDPKLYYNLAILSGRSGDNDTAIELLQKAKNLKPDYRDAYNGLYIFYTEMKKPSEAQAILKEYIASIDANDKEFLEKLK